MDVLQFLTMLEQHALYFALLQEVDDIWEAALSKRLTATLIRSAPDMTARYAVFRKTFAINCWHENRSESVAMWSLYTTEGHGIAIQSTVGRLMESFRSNARAVNIGRVFYEDHDRDYDEPYSDSGLNMLKPAFQSGSATGMNLNCERWSTPWINCRQTQFQGFRYHHRSTAFS
jgi:hypothetical protein